MINYKYNETAYAELIFKKGFQTKYMPTELKLLVLYLRDVLKLKPKQREEFIYQFCQKYIPNFKKEKFFKIINKSLKNALKKDQKLIDIDKIDIYKSEIDYINSLDINYEYKKVLFTFLVQYKLNKKIYEYKFDKPYNNLYFQGGKKKYNNIKKMSNIPVKMNINDEVINELSNSDLIEILHKGIIKLNYLKECLSEMNDEVAISVLNFDNIGYYLDYYNGNSKIIKCENCNKLIKKTCNKTKYCKECAKEIERIQERENAKIRMRKYRNKLKNKNVTEIENAQNSDK